MPKRMLDDSLLNSPSMRKCSARAQDAFHRFLLLCDDFGCFEVEPRQLWARGWPHRDDVTERNILPWLEEYVAAGMACLWTVNERQFCYLTGWHGPHGQKPRAVYDPNAPSGTPGRHGSKRRTPEPPPALVAAVKAGARRDADGKPPGTHREGDPENSNDSTPAREMTGKLPGSYRENEFPAPAVPVPVPVPIAVPDLAADEPPRQLLVFDRVEGTEKRVVPKEPPAEKADPRFKPTVDALCAAFQQTKGEPYVFKARDGKAVREHLKADAIATPGEAARRFTLALSLSRWPGCSTISHLFERWNELAGPSPPNGHRVIEPAAPHSAFGSITHEVKL